MMLGNLWHERANKKHPQSASWDSKLENEVSSACCFSKFHFFHHLMSAHQYAARKKIYTKELSERLYSSLYGEEKTLVEAEHKHFYSLFSLLLLNSRSIFDIPTLTHTQNSTHKTLTISFFFFSYPKASNFQCTWYMKYILYDIIKESWKIKVQQLQWKLLQFSLKKKTENFTCCWFDDEWIRKILSTRCCFKTFHFISFLITVNNWSESLITH